MKIYNTLTRKIEEFVPWQEGKVGLYTCGPTVYHYAHIGNMRNYIGHDILDKTLRYLGYDVKRVMNITDVGHLTSDSDSGDDKMVSSAKKEHKTVMNFDGLLYIVGSIPMFIITILLLLVNAGLYLGKGLTGTELLWNYARYIVPTFFLPILTAILIMKIEHKEVKPMAKGLLCYPLFLGSWLAINFKCLFKRNTKWEKIEHVRNIKINEII